MVKSFKKIAIAAAAVLGFASAAQAKVVLTLESYTIGGVLLEQRICDSSNFAACGAGFSQISGGLTFAGSLVGFNVSTTSFTGNMPGSPSSATLDASTTRVSRTGAGEGFFYIDVYATDYLFPSGAAKTLTGSASLSSTSFSALDALDSRFYVDATNTGTFTTASVSCVQSIIRSNRCDAPTVAWVDGDGGAFAMRDIQIFRLNKDSSVNSTATGEVTPIPEPMTLSLVGAALIAAGAVARRKPKAA